MLVNFLTIKNYYKPEEPKPLTPLNIVFSFLNCSKSVSQTMSTDSTSTKETSSHFWKIIYAIRFPFSTKKSLAEKLKSKA